jgi:hypothetical protein
MNAVPLSVAAAAAATAALCAFCACCAFRALLVQLASSGLSRRLVGLAALGMGVLVFGCRVCLGRGNVSWCPYLDQWYAEFGNLVTPLAHGTLGLHHLFAGNNEHRVFLTRMLSLAATLANGGWDNRVLVLANYLLEAVMVAWVCALAWASLGWLRGSYVGAAALLPMLLVCDWESIVSSNETQFVLMAFGTVMALSLAQGYSLRSLASWGALALSLLTLGSMVTGFLTAVAMMATGLAVALVSRRGLGCAAAFGAVCAALAALGWFTRVEFTALYPIYAKSPAQWLAAFLAYAAWPMPANLLGFAFMWLPWLALSWRTLRSREVQAFAPFALGLGLWDLMQACALAWSRSGLSELVSSRYTEFMAWDLVANAAAAALLATGPRLQGRARPAAWAAMLLWLSCAGGFEIWRSGAVYRPYLEEFHAQTLEHEQRLGTFMRKGDPTVISGVEFPHIPFAAKDILPTLGDPLVQPLLPAPLRRDLVRDRQPSLLNGVEDGPLSYVALRVFAFGPWIAAAGAALLASALVGACLRRRRAMGP